MLHYFLSWCTRCGYRVCHQKYYLADCYVVTVYMNMRLRVTYLFSLVGCRLSFLEQNGTLYQPLNSKRSHLQAYNHKIIKIKGCITLKMV